MPQPTGNEIHVDQFLTEISVACLQEDDMFFAHWMFPEVQVKKQGGKYAVYDRGDWNRVVAQKRDRNAESAGGGYNVAKQTYFADIWAVHTLISDHDRDNQDEPIDLDEDAAIWVAQNMRIRQDVEFVSTYMTTGVWTGGTVADPTGTTDFVKFDAALSNPISTIKTEMRSVQKNICGRRPNRLLIGAATWDVISDHSEVLDRIKHTETGVITEDLFASLIGMKAGSVKVAESVQTTSAEGATTVIDFIGGSERMLLTYAPEKPSLRAPAAGYHFVWRGLGSSSGGFRTLDIRDDHKGSNKIEGEMSFDPNLVSAVAGVLFDDCIT